VLDCKREWACDRAELVSKASPAWCEGLSKREQARGSVSKATTASRLSLETSGWGPLSSQQSAPLPQACSGWDDPFGQLTPCFGKKSGRDESLGEKSSDCAIRCETEQLQSIETGGCERPDYAFGNCA
jgi:hypothetical protein